MFNCFKPIEVLSMSGGEIDLSIVNMKPRMSFKEWVTIIILCFVNVINYMDRVTLAGVLTDVQVYFKISESKIGLLQTVFVVSYMLFAPVIGYFGDRHSRCKIMAFGVFFWSLTTFMSSFMEDFTSFALYRAFIGIGQASFCTVAPTIISDMFVKDNRSKMLALFYFAIPVGSSFGYIVGSSIAKAAGTWQWSLRVTPLLGVVALVLILFVMEDPARGECEGNKQLTPTSWAEDMKELVKNPSFMLSTLGITCVTYVAGALAFWGPTFMLYGIRLQPGMESILFHDLSFKFGVVTMLAGILGLTLGLYLSQSFKERFPKIDPILCATGLFLTVPILTGCSFVITQSADLCFALLFFGLVTLNMSWAIVADILLYVVVPTRRSTAEAFQILISHALGDAGSPYLIGMISEVLQTPTTHVGNTTLSNVLDQTTATLLYHNDQMKFLSLQEALFSTGFIDLLGCIFFLCASMFILRDKQRVENIVKTEIMQSNINNDNPDDELEIYNLNDF